MRFTRSRASQHHHRAVDLFHGGALGRVQAVEFGLEGGVVEVAGLQTRWFELVDKLR